MRLVDGEVPEYPVFISSDRIDWVSLTDIVAVRRPDLLPACRDQRGLGEAEIRAQLDFWAGVLTDVVPDFLAGDAAAIDEAAVLIRQRVAEHPQRITVSLPQEATDDELAAAVADARVGVPDEVEVVGRRYRRPSSNTWWGRLLGR